MVLSLTDRLAISRVAIVRALHLGDLLLAVPAFRALRRAFPAAELTLIGLSWARDFVFRFRHYLDRWREFPGYPGLLEVDVDPRRTEAFLSAERAYRYDLVIQMHGNGQASNPFALALGGRRTVGFYAEAPPDGFWLAAPYPDDLHEIDRNLALVRMLGLNADDRRLEFPLLPGDWRALMERLSPRVFDQRPVVLLHVGARPPARRWPPERFAVVADALAARYGARLILSAGPGEEGIAARVRACMRAVPVDLAGQTTIGSLAALISRCDLVISNDTGPAHLAVALNRPSVTIFGPADRNRWAPLDARRHPIAFVPVACSPCPHWECPIDHRCLRWIEPEQVIELAERLLCEEARCG
ncbi:MAG TPA: glycosyltransferase family 9 protein [Chloroflexota bacterium]|nr:glycosyltransferase family 9 protein [Chloroflexota bacterium]